MANSDKNILITPATNTSGDPRIVYSPNTVANTITQRLTDSGTISFEGSAGQLFSITNSLTGTLFSVNDISGIPSIDVADTGLVRIAPFNGNLAIGSTAALSTARLSISAAASSIGVIVRGNATTPGNLQEWQDSSGNILTRISSDGSLIYGRFSGSGFSTNTGAAFIITNNSAISPLIVRGAASQTEDLLELQNSSSTVLGGSNGVGQIFTGSTTPILTATGGTIQSIASGANPLVTMASAHGFTTGDLVTLAGTTGNTYNGTFVVASTPASTTFTITSALTAGQAGTGGTASDPAQISVTARSAGTIGAIIRGAASQSANIFEVQNSSGTVLASVASNATFLINGIGVTTGDHRVGTNNYYTAALNVFARSTTEKGIALRANGTGQNANMIEVQSSAGTVLSGTSPNGQLFTGSTTSLTTNTGGATTTTSGNGTTATITTTSNHNLAVGDRVTVAGVTPTGYNGTHILTAVTSNTLSYASTTTGSQTVAGTVAVDAQASIVARSAATTPLILRAAVNQGVNMFRIEGSGGSATVTIDAAGAASFVGGAVVLTGGGSVSANGTINSAGSMRIGSTGATLSGTNVLFIANGTAPSANATSGGFLFVETGALKYRGTSGSNTTIVNADGTSPFPLLSTNNTFTGVNSFNNAVNIGGGSVGAVGLEIGSTLGSATTPFIDFHSGATATDFDSRIIASGGTGTNGAGTLTYTAASNIFTGTITAQSAFTAQANASIFGSNSGSIPLIVNGRSGQSVNLQEWQTNSPTTVAFVSQTGRGSFDTLNAPNGAFFGNLQSQPGNGAYLAVQGYSAGHRPLLVRGFGATTANLMDFETGAAVIVGGRNAVGQIFTGSITSLTSSIGVATSGASGTGTVATITTGANHNLAVGDIVTVAGVTPTGYNGRFSISAVTSNTISYANTTTGSQTIAGVVTADAQVSITPKSPGTIGLLIRSGSSAQTANFFLIQNAGGVTQFGVSATGEVSANSSVTTGGALNLNYASPTIASNNASAANVFTSTVTGVTIGSSTIRTTAFPADATTATATAGAGYMGLPQNATTTGAYTIVAADAGKHIYSTATRTVTIPANSGAGSVAFPVGTAITFVSGSGATTTIAITTDTMYLAGPGTTGSRTLAAFGMATAVKITSTAWIISGNGLT